MFHRLAMFIMICLVSILMDSEKLDQLTFLEKNVDSEVKSKRDRKKKIDTKINETEESDVRDREKHAFCLVTQNNILVKDTLNSKLMKWIVIVSIHF